MWSLLRWRSQATGLVFSGALVAWAIMAFHAWRSSTAGPLDIAGMAVMVIVTVGSIVAGASWQWLWSKVPSLERVVFPDLNGDWSGEIESTWTRSADTPRPDPLHVSVKIEQGLFETHLSGETLRSQFESTRVLVERTKGGKARMWYSYEARPKLTEADGNPPHQGVAWLEMDAAKDRDLLVGGYYTDRKSTGSITIHRTQTL